MMSTVTRCDECKRLSDESGIGYIGKSWILKKYRDVVANITTSNDLCRDCLIKSVNGNGLHQRSAYDDGTT